MLTENQHNAANLDPTDPSEAATAAEEPKEAGVGPSDIWASTGLDQITKDSTMEDIEGALHCLATALDGSPRARQALLRDGAVRILKAAGKSAPAKIVDAYLSVGESDGRQSRASRALELVQESGAELWHDPDGEAYLDVRGEQGERRTLLVRSRACRTWLSGLLYRADGDAIGGQAATDAMDVLCAMAIHDGPQREVYVRIAEADGVIYLDLADETWRAVRITAKGWDLVDEPPVRFRRPQAMRPLPVPKRLSGAWEALRSLLNMTVNEAWVLSVAWLVGTFRTGPYPILGMAGEHGTGKTTAGRVFRGLVDPSKAPLRSPPRDDQALVIAARNGHVLALDNLSRMPDWLSDALCRIATGGGYSARELYTDGDEVVFADRRPIILTSIECVATRGDLADRTIAVEMPLIPEDKRRTEAEMVKELDRIRPGVLAALLDAVVFGLRRRNEVRLDRLPRMADFALWVVACEPALPWDEGAFLEAYAAARDHSVRNSIDADPVATVLVELLDSEGPWTGTTTELLAALNARRDEGIFPPNDWPDSAQKLGGRLKRAAPSLRAAGWHVERGTGRDRYTIHITAKEHMSANDAHAAHNAHHDGPELGDVSTREQCEQPMQPRTYAHEQPALDLFGDNAPERGADADCVEL